MSGTQRRFVVVCEDGTEFTDYDTEREAATVAAKIDAGGQILPFHRMHCPGLHTVKDREAL